MRATLNAIKWSLDVDCIEDDAGRVYQVKDVEQDSWNRLSLTLDINPIENRISVFQGNDYNWYMESSRGTPYRLTDESILSFLKELQATIPPIK